MPRIRIAAAQLAADWGSPMIGVHREGVGYMIADKIKQVVKNRYGKFAETGGHEESC
jgi:hypothetical protein